MSIEDIRTVHHVDDSGQVCWHCETEGCEPAWPCDTAQVLAALDDCKADRLATWASNGELGVQTVEALAALDAANEDAARLAENLRDTAEASHQTGSVRDHWGTPTQKGPVPFEDCDDVGCFDAREALRLHDERVR